MPNEQPDTVGADLAALKIDRVTPPPRRRRRWPWLVAAGLVLAAAWVANGHRWVLDSPPVVKVARAARSSGVDLGPGPVLSGSGYIITGNRYVSLGTRVAGRIEAYLVEEGDRVEKGQGPI